MKEREVFHELLTHGFLSELIIRLRTAIARLYGNIIVLVKVDTGRLAVSQVENISFEVGRWGFFPDFRPVRFS